VRRGPAFKAAQGLFSLSAGTGMARFAAVSVHDTPPRRHNLFGGMVSLQATWASFSSRPRVLQPKRRQRHGALRCSMCARRVTVPSSGLRRAWSRIVRRGPVFKAAQGLFSPSAGTVSVHDTPPRRHNLFGGVVSLQATRASFSSRPRALQTQRRQRHGALAAVSVQDMLACRPQVSDERGVASCDAG
jgi:hypothetical protein